MKHGVDALVGHHLQQVFFGKAVHRIVKVVEMQQQVAVSKWVPQRVMKRKWMPINANVQEDGVDQINQLVFQVDLANRIRE